jgi:superfamily II DNA/RNA helicase
MPPEIRRITEQFLHNPVRVEVSRPASTVAATAQFLARSGREPHDKRDTLRRLIRSAEGLKNAIIFCNRKRDVATLHRSLLRHGFSVQALHGDMDQSARTAALEQFRKGEVTLLVASDVAARGLDIPEVSHVYNFDVPIHADDYVHRIGRTGRAGRTGVAISIVAGSNDAKAVAAIEKLIGQPIPFMDNQAEPSVAPQHAPAERAHRERPNRRHQSHRPVAPGAVARIDEARSRRSSPPARPRQDDGDDSHLPAFLLRPVTVKA